VLKLFDLAMASHYIIVFEPYFIEICDVNTGELQQVIPGTGLRAVNLSNGLIHGVSDINDKQTIFSIQLKK
jgi:hypothetical protein